MTDPFLVAVAAALVGRTAGAAARSLVELVQRKFAADAEVLEALEPAEQGSDQDLKVHRLGAALERATTEDPEFSRQLREAWAPDHGGVVNQISGTAGGHVAQARDVTGGISFGGIQKP